MTAQQVRAMAAHLLTNVEAFRCLGVSLEAVCRLVDRCPIRDFWGPAAAESAGLPRLDQGGIGSSSANAGAGEPPAPSALFTRGQLTDWCCVILHGRVALVSGDDAVHSTAGPWDVLAERVLLLEAAAAPMYRVDFDAAPASRIVHALCIPRALFTALLGPGSGSGAGGAALQAPAASQTALPALLPHRGLSTRALRSPTSTALGSPASAEGGGRSKRAPDSVLVPVSDKEFVL